MKNNELKITNELLQNVDAIIDLKLKTEDLLNQVDSLMKKCNEMLKK